MTIGIKNRSRTCLASRFNDFVTDRQDHDSRTRVDQHSRTTDTGKKSNLTCSHAGSRTENNGSFLHVLSFAADIFAHRRLSLCGNLSDTVVAEFQSKNRIRALRHGRTRSDSDCATANEGCRVNISRADFFRYRQNNRGVRASTFEIGSSNRIAIACGKICNREVERSLDVLC